MKYDFNMINNGPTIVFLHGWGVNRKIYNRIIDLIKFDCNYINIDLYGFGESSEPKDYFDVYEYAYQIFLLLKRCGIKRVILVGHSYGGRLSIILSSIFDIEIYRLVLTSSAGIVRFNLLTWLRVKTYKLCKYLYMHKIISRKFLDRFGSSDYNNATALMRRILSRVIRQDLRYLLKYISCETLLVWNKKDKDTPYWICKKLNKGIKKSLVVDYENGGHFTAFVNYNKFSKVLKHLCKN